MEDQKEAHISPLYGDNIQSNKKSIQFVRNVTSLAIGIGAGILRLESQYGFLFYVACSLAVGGMIHMFVAQGRPKEYVLKPLNEIWLDDMLSGLSSFVLTWTLFYGLVDA
ncbi:ER membrane protein complex subunit 6 [Trichomonascus vanleenenianus]|uniref:Emc6p n=1 Tax=Trichomonascus vanleenenianus TaxID=2268995 RepID=UPI003ECB991C